MTFIELTPHSNRKKFTEGIVRVCFRHFSPTKNSYERLPVAIIFIGAKLMKDIGFGKTDKMSIVFDTDKKDQFVIKKEKEGYTAILTPSGSAYKIQPRWILDVPEDVSTK